MQIIDVSAVQGLVCYCCTTVLNGTKISRPMTEVGYDDVVSGEKVFRVYRCPVSNKVINVEEI